MSNNLLTLIVVAALIGTFLSVSPQVSRPLGPRATAFDASAPASVLQADQPASPVLRNLPAMLAPAVSPGAALGDAGQRTIDESAKRAAARAAIEAGGYESVTVLGKRSDGTWRARAYRGTTEVQLIVDDGGKVSAE